MSIKKLVIALAALTTGEASFALERSADGSGDALLAPFYSVRPGLSTVFSVTNHADEAKAVRVVIAEGRNGRATLTFNVYLAARDSWHGGLVLDSEPSPPAGPFLVTNDASCTSAPTPAEGQPFRYNAFSGPNDDGYGMGQRAWEGQIEVFDLGTLTGAAAALAASSDCNGLRTRLQSGAWAQNPNADLTRPTGRLSLETQLVDVAGGVAYNVETFALDGFSAEPRHGPGDADSNAVRIYKPTAKNAQGRFDAGGVEIDGDRPADAVSVLMMAAELEGPFSVEDSLDARTRWAVTFPTRPAYLDNRPGRDETIELLGPPFEFEDIVLDPPGCLETTWQTIDRSGVLGTAKELPLCTQVNSVDVLAGEGAGAEAAGMEFYTGEVESGRLRIGLHPERHTLAYAVPGNTVARGLPTLAIPMIEVRNANAQPGLLASYAITGKVVRYREDLVDF